jgi:hypothetical protein
MIMTFRMPLLLGSLSVALCLACGGVPDAGTRADDPPLRGDYLGQESPGDVPKLFAPGIVATGLAIRDVAITPEGDEIFFSVSVGRHRYTTIARVRRVDGVWQDPEIAPFATDPRYKHLEPAISPDGSRLFFASTRPRDAEQTEPADADIWAVDRTDAGWGEPYNLGPPVNTPGNEYFPSPTQDGTLYFTRNPALRCREGILSARLVDGRYEEPEELPDTVNAAERQFNAFVAPDESYLILPAAREDSLGGIDYYVSFRDESGRWSELVHVAAPVSHESPREWSSYVTRDGKYLFFMSGRTTARHPEGLTWEGLHALRERPAGASTNIFWVEAAFLADLRGEASWPE